MTPLHGLLTALVLLRLAELVHARRNTQRLLARGGREVGAGHYPLFMILHGAWLAALALAISPDRLPSPTLLALFSLLMMARLWVVLSLGPYWTTRIITLPGAPLRRRGPYRFLRHPNYVIVAAEIAVLPLAFGAWELAALFSLLNGLLLRHRIRIENAALADRRILETSLKGT